MVFKPSETQFDCSQRSTEVAEWVHACVKERKYQGASQECVTEAQVVFCTPVCRDR